MVQCFSNSGRDEALVASEPVEFVGTPKRAKHVTGINTSIGDGDRFNGKLLGFHGIPYVSICFQCRSLSLHGLIMVNITFAFHEPLKLILDTSSMNDLLEVTSIRCRPLSDI